jgi:Fur family transcriptional regulator, zinc uptake regulator
MKTSAERLEWALTICEKSHVRMTPVRSAILKFLSQQRLPMDLDSISHVQGIDNCWDPTTVYRTLMMFKDAGLVRCVGTLTKSSLFVLKVPHDANNFMICERCGAVSELELPSGTLTTIQRVAVDHGFAAARQCLELQGLCRACEAELRKGVQASKLMPRHCSM